jgi:hypothetical protein
LNDVYASEIAPRFPLPQPTLMQRDPGIQPAPIGWQASVINYGGTSRTLKTGAICAYWPLAIFTGDDVPSPDESGPINE